MPSCCCDGCRRSSSSRAATLEPRPDRRARAGAGAARTVAGAGARRPRQPRHPHGRRVTRPWAFASVFGTTDPVLRTENAVVCGLNWYVRGVTRAVGSTAGSLRPRPSATPGRAACGRLPSPPRRCSLARLAEVPAQAPGRRAASARRSGSRADPRWPYSPEHRRRAPRVRGSRRRGSRVARHRAGPRPRPGSARRTACMSSAGRQTRSRSRHASGETARSCRPASSGLHVREGCDLSAKTAKLGVAPPSLRPRIHRG